MTMLGNIIFPWLWDFGSMAKLLMIPCLLAEWLILRRMANITYTKALVQALAVNALSTICYLPVMCLGQQIFHDIPWGEVGPKLFWIVFLGTVLIEALGYLLFRHGIKRSLLVSLVCNTVSYLIIFLFWDAVFPKPWPFWKTLLHSFA